MMKGASSIKVTSDAYYSLKVLKKFFKEKHGRTYSISDLITAGNLVLLDLLKINPSMVLDILEESKLLRLQKNKGEFKANIFETLRQRYPAIETTQATNNTQFIIDIITKLIEESHLEAATLLLFEYKNMIEEDTFKDLASKILEEQVKKNKD